MELSNSYYQNIGKLPAVFKQIKDASVPERMTNQLLKDWGFSSTNDRPLIALLKSLGFLTPEGKPTSRYESYRDHSRSKQILGEALKEAYSELFLIKENPEPTDKDAIQGKFKSYHNTSDRVAGLMQKTFFALLDLADLSQDVAKVSSRPTQSEETIVPQIDTYEPQPELSIAPLRFSGLHYNIQIHLPATKDVEVYNSIFKSLKEHLID